LTCRSTKLNCSLRRLASLGCCYSAPSIASSGCASCRQSLQYTLPGARATGLEQPPLGGACRRHAPGNAAFRLLELPWSSPCAGSACFRRVRCNSPCRLEPPWCSRPLGTFCPAMHVIVLLAASSSSEAACLLAPPAAPMRLAVLCIADSGLGTALLVAPLAPAMRHAARLPQPAHTPSQPSTLR
jgi:hypothetical protein